MILRIIGDLFPEFVEEAYAYVVFFFMRSFEFPVATKLHCGDHIRLSATSIRGDNNSLISSFYIAVEPIRKGL